MTRARGAGGTDGRRRGCRPATLCCSRQFARDGVYGQLRSQHPGERGPRPLIRHVGSRHPKTPRRFGEAHTRHLRQFAGGRIGPLAAVALPPVDEVVDIIKEGGFYSDTARDILDFTGGAA